MLHVFTKRRFLRNVVAGDESKPRDAQAIIYSGMFAFTLEDLTLSRTLNGRDPLGTLAVWQHRARDMVPNLSSVSRHAEGFQLLLTAMAWWPEFARRHGRPRTDLQRYFLLVEQAHARAVRVSGEDWPLPGTRRLNAAEPGLWISANRAHYLLDSPLVNGTWGLYRRPAINAGLLLENMRLANSALEAEIREATPKMEDLFVHLTPCMTNDDVVKIAVSSRHSLVQALSENLRELPTRNKLRDALVTPSEPQITRDLARMVRGCPKDLSAEDIVAQGLRDLHEYESTFTRVQRCERLLATIEAVFEYACAEESASTLPQLAAELPLDLLALARAMEGFADSGSYDGLAAERVKSYQAISLQSKSELLRGVIKQHAVLSEARGNAPWLTVEEGDRIERRVSLVRPAAEQLAPATAWRNDYYLPTLQRLAHQLQVRRA